ncbi:MAG: hypothetical protein IJC88_03225 [Oscillospiraceae bacterium]|nr:hypothetical protein [Oscillospiraceae bacterium]
MFKKAILILLTWSLIISMGVAAAETPNTTVKEETIETSEQIPKEKRSNWETTDIPSGETPIEPMDKSAAPIESSVPTAEQPTGVSGFLDTYATPMISIILLILAFFFVIFYRRNNY